MNRLGTREWIQNRIEDLTEDCSKLREIAPETVNTFDSWSALKLILLSTTVYMYTTVISDHRERFYYIDALSGSGVSEYGDFGECFLGSPILAAKSAVEPFQKMYFIEDDDDKVEALEERLEYAFYESDMEITPPHSYEVIPGDANEEIANVVEDIWRQEHLHGTSPNFHHLTFIDNQGLDFKMQSVNEISPTLSGDLLINFPTSNVLRATGHAPSYDSLTNFYGGDGWTNDSTKAELVNRYRQILRGLDKEKQVKANVESGVKNFEYDMIYATRQTSSDSEYIRAIQYARDFIEEVDGADVNEMLDILKGDQVTMGDFLPESKKESQRRIGDYND